MTGHFLYTRQYITRSPTRVETEKGSERVYGLTLNRTAILSYKKQSHVHCMSEPYVSQILK